MTNSLIQAGAQPTSECLHGLIEIAKVCVIFAGGYFSHWLLLRRDRRAREHLFLSFMTQLKGEVLHVWPRDGFDIHYRNKIPNIAHAAAPVLCDLSGSRGVEFEKMINALCRHADADMQAETGRQRILEDIDAITRFFDS